MSLPIQQYIKLVSSNIRNFASYKFTVLFKPVRDPCNFSVAQNLGLIL